MFELALIHILGVIAFLFIVFVLLKKHIESFLNIKVCALCAAVSITWLSSLLLKNLQFISLSNTIIAILIGQSIVGIMYSYESYAKESKSSLNLMWLKKLLIIIAGTTTAYYLIETNGIVQLCLILVSLLILLVFGFWFNNDYDGKIENERIKKMHNNDRDDNKKQDSNLKSALLELEKKFERCCD